MKTYIALFRGINVGGKSVLPMRELVALLERLGLRNIKTYIQSGNAVFQCKEKNVSVISSRISAAIKQTCGFEPRVLLLGLDELENAIVSNPFPEAESEPKTLHVNFLFSTPKNPDIKALEGVQGDRERLVVMGSVLYLHAPDGIGRSKLAANIEKLLGVSVTGRNWHSVCKIMAMAKQCS